MWRAVLLAAVVSIGAFGCSKGHNWESVADDDPRLEAAREEARSRWDEFVTAFSSRKPLTEFTVEVLYEEGGNSEYILLQVSNITDSDITGAILNFPQKVDKMRGESITTPVSSLSDWTYSTADGDEVGSFVATVRKEIEQRD